MQAPSCQPDQAMAPHQRTAAIQAHARTSRYLPDRVTADAQSLSWGSQQHCQEGSSARVGQCKIGCQRQELTQS